MSYHTWSIDGYGICVDDIKTTKKRVLDLLARAPQVKEDFFENEIDENTNEIDFMAAVDEYENAACYRGLAPLLEEIILANEDIEFVVCDDFESTAYLLYVPNYPWNMNEREKNLSKEYIDNIFKKYISLLTDDINDIKIRTYSVENGG